MRLPLPARLLPLAALCFPLFAQEEEGFPVVVDGQEVARVYASVQGFSAKERAAEIEHRITVLAEKPFTGPFAVRAIPTEKATAVYAGQLLVMAVHELDAQAVGASQEELARRYAGNIQKAIETYHVRHTWLSFLVATAKALVAWLLFCLSAWGLWRVVGWLGRRVEWRFNQETARSGAVGFHRVLLERGRLVLLAGVRFLVGLTLLVEFSFLLSYTFGLFPQTAGISNTLLDSLVHMLSSVALALVDYLPSGGFVVVAIVATHYLLKVLKFVAQAIERSDISISGMHPEMAKPTYQLARLVVLLFALVVTFPYLPGGKSDAFKGISIFLGLLLSLGSSSAVSNILAGLVLTYMRPYRSGDRVKIADTIGDVLERTLLVTRLHTIKNVEVVIPNSAILNNQILNYSALARTRGLILNTTVTIGYDAPWRTVHDLLTRAALTTDGILADPAPFVLETSLNDFNISYELNAYTDRANEFQNTYSRLHEAIQDSFNRAGVEIMSPSFYAIRDGNTVTIPEDHRPADYEAPSFRIQEVKASAASLPDAWRASRRS